MINRKTNCIVFLCFLLLMGSLPGYSQTINPIPNASFESWTLVNMEPVFDDWTTYNQFTNGNFNVVPDSPGYDGSYAMKLQVVDLGAFGMLAGYAETSFSLDFKPQTLGAFLKTNVQPGDTVYINIRLDSAMVLVGEGRVAVHANWNSYSFIQVPISYYSDHQPDKATLSLEAGSLSNNPVPQTGTSMSIDQLAFDWVPDTVAPEIHLLGNNPDTLWEGQTYLDPGAEAFDNQDGDLTDSIHIEGAVNVMVTGEYQLVYQVSDLSGNQAEPAIRTIYVMSKPDTTVSGSPVLGEASRDLMIKPLGTLQRQSYHLQVTNGTPIELHMQLFDLTGRQVAQVYNGALLPGKHLMTLPNVGLPQGWYILRYTTDQTQVKSIKILVMD